MEEFDVIIIGVGQAGNPLATAFADAGKKTAVIEEKYVGGSCINYGCTPTKVMIASAERAHLARKSKEMGISTEPVEVNLASIVTRKDEIVKSFREGIAERINNSSSELIYGHAFFSGRKTVTINLRSGGTRRLQAETIVIDTGTTARIPKLTGLQDVAYLTSTTIMDLEVVPEHLIILGGGYIALEFGQMFRRFGSQVDIVELEDQLMAHEDHDIAKEVQNILEDEGIQVWLNSRAVDVKQITGGDIHLTISNGKQEEVLNGTHLLIATGRIPNTRDLNLQSSDIHYDEQGYIQVNERLETNIAGVFAAGDVKGGPAFTHIAYDDFRVIKANLIDGSNASITGRLVPYVLYTDPQLGRIGMTEKSAQQAGKKYRVARMPMKNVSRAIEVDRTKGFIKALVEVDTGQILGGAVLGVEGGEIMSMLEIAMMGKLPYTALKDGIFAHPTLAESLNNLFADL